MNNPNLTKARKRVPGQSHLFLFSGDTYKGFPVYQHEDGLVLNFLDRTYDAISAAINKHSRIFAVRVDLHFPYYFSASGGELFSNNYLETFIKMLRRELKHYAETGKKLGRRRHSVEFDYIWTREYGPRSEKPHFHLLLIFNGHTFNTLGCFSNVRKSLYNRIGESWAESLRLHVAEGVKYVYFPQDGGYHVDPRHPESLYQLFERASYLTKVATKNFNDGCHPFGGSRN